MTDEQYLFMQDVREKKRTARGSYNRRTHTGKAGGVKLPSDYLTKKEREAMNGEPTTYRINSPMTWQDFKAMPDDLKAAYLNWLREKFNAPDNAIADMFGIHRTSLFKHLQSIGLQNHKHRGPRAAWDVEGFTTWRKGAGDDAAEPTEETTAQEEKTVRLDPLEELMPLALPEEAEEIQPAEAEPLQPTSGWMQFDGPADQALQTIGNLLRGKNVRLRITWDPITTEGAQYDRR